MIRYRIEMKNGRRFIATVETTIREVTDTEWDW
jgi:hypothetical protein